MKLHAHHVVVGESSVEVSIQVDSPKLADAGLPQRLWFEFPASYAGSVSQRADGLVMAMLPLAMQLGEPLEVLAPLDRTSIEGMYEYQRVLNAWLPQRYSLIDILARDLQPGLPPSVLAAGATFSGGFDSLFTLFRHLEPEVLAAEHRLRHVIFMHGLDIPLEDERTFAVTSAAYGEMLHKLGVRLVTGRTNVRRFIDRSDWEMSHGVALAASAHLLPGLWNRFYIPSSNAYWETHPWGSDPRLDHHLSSDRLRLVYDGGGFWKVDKVRAVAQHPETYDTLRICWEHPDGLMNCGRCQKCLRAMIALECMGKLSNYTVFSSQIDRGRIRSLRFSKVVMAQVSQLLHFTLETGRSDFASDLRWALFWSRLRNAAKALKRQLRRFV